MRNPVFSTHYGSSAAPLVGEQVSSDIRYLFPVQFWWSAPRFHAARSSSSICAHELISRSYQRLLASPRLTIRMDRRLLTDRGAYFFLFLNQEIASASRTARSAASIASLNVIGSRGSIGRTISTLTIWRSAAHWSRCGSCTIFPSQRTTACRCLSGRSNSDDPSEAAIDCGKSTNPTAYPFGGYSEDGVKASITELFFDAQSSQSLFRSLCGVASKGSSRIEANAARLHWQHGLQYTSVERGITSGLLSSPAMPSFG